MSAGTVDGEFPPACVAVAGWGDTRDDALAGARHAERATTVNTAAPIERAAMEVGYVLAVRITLERGGWMLGRPDLPRRRPVP
jgi:hypothetical protein